MLPGDLALGTLVILSVVCVVAYFLKGFSGFGPAIVLVPVVTLAVGPDMALANSALIDLVVGAALVVVLDYEPDDWRLVGRMAVLVAAGALVGGLLVGMIPGSTVSYLIGGFVLVFSLWLMASGDRSSLEGNKPYLWIGSLLGGFTGGLVGISGPFIVAGARPLLDKTTFRRVIVPVFLVANVFKLIAYVSTGVWSMEATLLALSLSPGVIAGLMIGYLTHPRVDERLFDLVIGTVLIVLSIRLLLPLV